MDKKPYYISTAIAYTSAKPHIGNTYEIVLADAIARYKRMTGYDVYFQTGTDEHGQKIQEKAEAAGITPQQHVDKVAGEVKTIWDLMNTTYDKFIRICRSCHEGKCNWGIATQRPDLVKRLDPEVGYKRLVNLVTAWEHEIQEMMGGIGINSVEALRGNRLMLRGVGLNEPELKILGIRYAGESL